MINALISKETWKLVPPTDAHNLVASEWVFWIKYNYDGSLEHYKARLIVVGNHQEVGIDFHDTFASVVCPAIVCLVWSIDITNHWYVLQVDVKNASFHGLFPEKVYMWQPPCFVDPHFPTHVCLIKKPICGLKQAPWAWFHCFSSFLLIDGFSCSQSNPSMFPFHHNSHVLLLLPYIDDIILTGSSISLFFSFIYALFKQLAKKDLGDLYYFLGVQVIHSTSGLFFVSAQIHFSPPTLISSSYLQTCSHSYGC